MIATVVIAVVVRPIRIEAKADQAVMVMMAEPAACS